jgi:hypothetical protein
VPNGGEGRRDSHVLLPLTVGGMSTAARLPFGRGARRQVGLARRPRGESRLGRGKFFDRNFGGEVFFFFLHVEDFSPF